MPRVEEFCLETIPIDVENFYDCVYDCLCDGDNTPQAEDMFNQMLEDLCENDYNFWECEYGYDDIEAEDLTMLAAYGNNGDSLGRRLRKYHQHMFIQQKESILETIQEKLNQR
jgi:pentatricopeptide repeat protein